MSTKTAQRQDRLREVLDEAMERPTAERLAFVDLECQGDVGLRDEAMSLLNALTRAGHLLEPAAMAPRSEAPAPKLTGLTIGSYLIGERMGAGGMGVVYRATDTRLGRTVAVKALPHGLAADPQRRARLEREARVLAALSHPNIGAIYGIEDSPQGPVLVLEHVQGETLAERIKRGLAVEECRVIAAQILLALEGAHGAGVVHRDIKPANVMVGTSEAGLDVKVLDFGIARLGPSVAPQPGSDSVLVTHAGSFVGTAAYMSPEQARGRAADRRTDIWAFGCVLFEMLTGRPAFEGQTISDTIASVLRVEPDWAKIPTSVPPGVCAVLRRCLEKDETRRLRDAGDVRIELDEAWDAPAGEAIPRRRLSMLSVAVLLVGVAVGAAALLWLRSEPAHERRVATHFTIEVPQSKPLRSDAFGGCVAVSPDGQTVVYSAGPVQDPGPQLYVRRLNGFADSPIAGTEHGFSPFFSPDGRWIGFFCLLLDGSPSLKRVPLEGGVPQTIVTANGLGFGGCWTEDNFIVFSVTGGLRKVPAGGGEVSDVCKPAAGSSEILGLPESLPGGRTLLMTCTYRVNDGYAARIEALTLGSGQRRVLIEDASCPRYLPGLKMLAFRQSGTLVGAPFNPGTLSLGEEARPIGPVPSSASAANIQFSISPTGTLAYVLGIAVHPGDELAWYYPGGRVEPVYHAKDPIITLRLSPDSKRVAYTTSSANPALWVLDLQRGSPQLVFTNPRLGFPVWSPDGKQIAISVGKGSQDVIEILPADGTSPPRLLYANPAGHNCSPSGFSPDGSELLIFMDIPDPSTSDIFVLTMPSTPGQLATIRNLLDTPADRVAARVSPDGRFVAYASTETGRSEIYVQDYPGMKHKLLVSTGGGERPIWSSDSATIFYQSYGSLDSVRLTQTPELGVDNPARVLPRIPFGRYDAAPDGSRFIMARASGDWVAPNSVFVVVNADAEIRAAAQRK